ncbi:MAG: B-box zinc finger protein [Caulobacteraceae bacterium]
MNCKYHKESEAKYICEKCKQPICDECAVEVNGGKICSSCISKSVFSNKGEAHRSSLFESFIFFCFAVVPGAAQMYMNLFKRGFQLMITFIGSITILIYLNVESFIPLVLIPAWFFSFFDSYAIRRRLRNGEEVEDVEVYEYSIFIKYKKYTGVAMLILGALGIVNAFEHTGLRLIFGSNLYWSIKRSIIPMVLVLAGIYTLTRTKKAKEEADTFEKNIES